jgi:hypothetical protein
MSWMKYWTEIKSTLTMFFAQNKALYVTDDNEDHRSKSIKDYRQWNDWINK